MKRPENHFYTYKYGGNGLTIPTRWKSRNPPPKSPKVNPNFTFVSEQNTFLTEILDNHPSFLGADIASSILLHSTNNTKTYLWFFGDTLLGNINSGKRQWSTLSPSPPLYPSTRNSIGLWTITNNNPSTSVLEHYAPTYTGQPGQNGVTYGFFSPTQPDITNNPVVYWPIAVIKINNEIYTLCQKCAATSLNIVGHDIVKLNATPYNEPSKWTYEYLSTIPGVDNNTTIGNALITYKNYVYLYGSKNGPTYNGFVTRISYNDFIDGIWNNLQVYDQNQWSPYYTIKLSNFIFTPLSLSSTIMWHNYMSKWIMLSITAFAIGSKVKLFYSDNLVGPWSEPILIYDIPSSYLINSNVIYYAPNFHPEFMVNNNSNEIYWSYNLNSFDINDLTNNLFLYTPKVIKTLVSL
jgi:hypothetical protein